MNAICKRGRKLAQEGRRHGSFFLKPVVLMEVVVGFVVGFVVGLFLVLNFLASPNARRASRITTKTVIATA